LDVAVGIGVAVSRASRVSMGMVVGVDKSSVGVSGTGVERGVAVGSMAVRLQEVNKTASMTITMRDFIQSSFSSKIVPAQVINGNSLLDAPNYE
jgi:hypothetical protein